jgi:hypothetical protein
MSITTGEAQAQGDLSTQITTNPSEAAPGVRLQDGLCMGAVPCKPGYPYNWVGPEWRSKWGVAGWGGWGDVCGTRLREVVGLLHGRRLPPTRAGIDPGGTFARRTGDVAGCDDRGNGSNLVT